MCSIITRLQYSNQVLFELQVFPLLMRQFTSEEQSSFVWQFICSIPVSLLEDFLPWMTSFFSPDEQVEFICCIKSIVPKDILLQEVDPDLISQLLQLFNNNFTL